MKPENILYEDNHVIVVNKMPSEIVQGDKTGDATLPDAIKAYLKEKYNKPGNVFCGVIHRLDRPTSGAVVFAKTSKGLERLNAQFREKDTHKVYWAIVDKLPTEKNGELVHYLKKNEKQNKSYISTAKTLGAKEAKLSYRWIKSSDNYHLLEVHLETGRHHQIRAQLSSIGYIIKGDLRAFLNEIRGDQTADSFTLYINSLFNIICWFIYTFLKYINLSHNISNCDSNILNFFIKFIF